MAVTARSVVDKSRDPGYCKDLHINADWDFWISVYENNIKGYYVDKTIYKRRF